MRYVLVFLGFILVLEGVVRIWLGAPYPLQVVDDLGMLPASHSVVTQSREGYVTHRMNEAGLNSGPMMSAAACATVVVMGDSFVLAAEVPRAANFVSQLAGRFPAYHWVNGGYVGLSPQGWVPLLKHIQQFHRPDAVILVLNQQNVMQALTGQAVVMAEGAILNKVKAALARSALLHLLFQRFFVIPEPDARQWENLGAQDIVVLMRQLQSFLRQAAAFQPTVVVYLPELYYQGRPLQATQPQPDTEALLKTQVETLGLPFISLTPGLQAWVEAEQRIPVGFQHGFGITGHLNPMGHQAVATLLAGQLQDALPVCEGGGV